MVNVDKLRGKMKEARLSVEDVATAMNIDRATLYRKLNAAGETFTIREAHQIIEILSLNKEEVDAIFFADTVA